MNLPRAGQSIILQGAHDGNIPRIAYQRLAQPWGANPATVP